MAIRNSDDFSYDGDEEYDSKSSSSSEEEFCKLDLKRQSLFPHISRRNKGNEDQPDPSFSFCSEGSRPRSMPYRRDSLSTHLMKHSASVIEAVFKQGLRKPIEFYPYENDVDDGISIMSSQQFMLEDAVFFSPFPRVVIEASAPHRVVHANAAYACRYGSSSSVFQASHAYSENEIKMAARKLFRPSDTLTIHPICSAMGWGNESLSVTHFLIQTNAVKTPEQDATFEKTALSLGQQSSRTVG